MQRFSSQKNLGFTIVELIVVISVIAILAGITIVGYGAWQKGIRTDQVVSDLKAAAAAMESARNEQNGYPSSLPSTVKASDGVTLTVIETSSGTFCIDGKSTTDTTINYYIDQSLVSSSAKTGTCATRVASVAPNTPTAVTVENFGTGLRVSWASPGGTVTQYSVQCARDAAYISDVVGATVAPPLLTVDIPVSTSAQYFCKVNAINSAGSGAWSTTIAATIGVVTAIDTGGSYDCFIVTNGSAYCRGTDSNGYFGSGTTTSVTTAPIKVSLSGSLAGKTIKQIAIGNNHACVVASDDNIYCWGRNSSGQLGNGDIYSNRVYLASPVVTSGVLAGKTIKQVNAASDNTCVIASDNNAYCWGQNASGQLGNNSNTTSYVPVAVTTSGVLSGKTIKQIEMATFSACAVASDNNAYCWGSNPGNNTSSSIVPVAVTTSGVLSGKTIKSISVGSSPSCVLASDDRVYCWGGNTYGELGNNSTTASLVPVAVNASGVLSGKTIISIASGSGHACAVSSEGLVYCWGRNTAGQLGNNSTTSSSVPVAVDTTGGLNGKKVKSLSIEWQRTCALTTDNNSVCWGNNVPGTFDGEANQNRLIPTAIAVPLI